MWGSFTFSPSASWLLASLWVLRCQLAYSVAANTVGLLPSIFPFAQVR
ncbi:hypothetical protein AB7W30_17520 [Providencia manganoxydans]